MLGNVNVASVVAVYRHLPKAETDNIPVGQFNAKGS